MKKRKDIAKELKLWFVRQFKDKTTTVSAIVLGIVIIFRHPLTITVNRYWVEPIASEIHKSVGADIVLLFFFLWILVYYGLKTLKSYQPNCRLVAFSLIVTVVYATIRFNKNPVWNFLETKNVPCIKYMDIILFTGLVSFIFLIRFICKTLHEMPKENKNYFYNDLPLSNNDKDVFEFRQYAESVAKGINESVFKKAFAIGITAKWGSGKTSFIKMIISELDKLESDKKKSIIIDFNPWRSTSPNAIIRDFFETMRSEMNNYGFDIDHLLADYSKKIIALNNSNLITGIFSAFTEPTDSSVGKLFDKIDNVLKKIGKKIIIVIDDVDRLSDDEVIEVIRLIRNTANFYNTFFIVAYDKAYVLQCLKNNGIVQNETFLEKIFQLEITLPYFDKQVLIDKLFENLKEIISEKNKNIVDEYKERVISDRFFLLELYKWIRNLRDVTLLSNSIKINIGQKEDDVELVDYILIELLRVKFTTVYVAFFENYQEFLELNIGNYTDIGQTYKLKYEQQKNSPSGENSTEQSCLYGYLKKNQEKLAISENAIEKINNLIELLFEGEKIGQRRMPIPRKNLRLSIRSVKQFHLYYSYQIPDWFFAESKLYEILKLPLSEMKEQFKFWASPKMNDQLKVGIQQLKIAEDITSVEMFENLVSAIFCLANDTANKENHFMGFYVNKSWLAKLLDQGRFVYADNNGKGYNEFIKIVFSCDNPYYQAVFLKEVLNSDSYYQNTESPFMKKSDAVNYLIQYFKTVCEVEETLNPKVCFFYGCCNILSEGEDENINAHIPAADKYLIEFISTKDLDTYLRCTISSNNEENDNPKYQINPNPRILFGSFDKFEEFLKEQKVSKWKTLEKYREFYEKAREAGNKWIDFDFDDIDI